MLYKKQKYFYTKSKEVTIYQFIKAGVYLCFVCGARFFMKDTVICIDSDLNRTRKVYQALEEICYEFDLSKPLWLDHNKNDFIHHSKTRFNSDSFVEDIDFDFLEIQVIEED